ncbi:MAG: D-2-hydroxyacid dehydrogenase [bacterium]
MKLLVLIDLKDKYLDDLRESFSELEIVKSLEIEEQKKEIKDAEIVICGGNGLKEELLKAANNLQWIQSWSAGLDAFNNDQILEQLQEKEIKLCSSSGIHGDPIAEHVMGFLINYSRRLYDYYRMQQKKEWDFIQVDQLSGKSLAIIGLGSIGLEIAARAKAFNMTTLGVKRNFSENIDNIDELSYNHQLLEVLEKADYIVVTVPLTDETRDMFGEKEFAVMKKSAFFVNIARGGVVDEKALIKALERKEIAGAGLDVFAEEPLDSDSPLYQMENVYITPHVSGAHPDYNKNAIGIFKENLVRYLDEEELINLMDYSLGY